MHCPARCTDSQRPIVRRGVLAQATVRGICGIGQQVEQAFAALIGWKIAAVFVLIDSVAFGKEMYCSFIFTSLTMWRFACFINVITTLLWGGSVNMILL